MNPLQQRTNKVIGKIQSSKQSSAKPAAQPQSQPAQSNGAEGAIASSIQAMTTLNEKVMELAMKRVDQSDEIAEMVESVAKAIEANTAALANLEAVVTALKANTAAMQKVAAKKPATKKAPTGPKRRKVRARGPSGQSYEFDIEED